MSNILSLEVLQALLNSANASKPTAFKETYLNGQIVDLCETAIEYYRRWRSAEDLLKDYTQVLTD